MGDTKEKEHIMGFESGSITSPSRDNRFGRGYGPIARETTPRISFYIVYWELGRSHEEGTLSVFENRVLKRIFGPKKDGVTGEWRELHNEELNDLYSSSNIFRVIKSTRMRWAGHVARMGKRRGVCRVLVGKPKEKRPFGRPRLRWEDNIRWIFRKCDVGAWTGSSWLNIGTGASGGHL